MASYVHGGVMLRIDRLSKQVVSGRGSGRSTYGSRHIRFARWSCTVWLLSQKEKKDGAIDAEGRPRGGL
jgi:hypothetical protein